MAALSLAALLMVLASTCFISSAVPPGPYRGYQTSFATSQAASYDPRTGAVLSAVKVTSRQCSVIKRSTRYEKVHVPFVCHVMSGRVMPLPRMTEVSKASIMASMKKHGWAVCYKVMQVPVHRFQRLPVCCPGTIPIPNGGCVCKKSLAAAQAASTTPRMPTMPSPGQLLQQLLQQAVQEMQQLHPAYQFRPTPPPVRSPVVMQPPRPYRGMMPRGPMVTASPGALIKQAMFQRGRGGPAYTTDKSGPADLLKHIAIKNLLSSSGPSPMARRPPQSPMGDWHNDVARYLAAMMYQKMLVEQQQKTLQEEIERQAGLRKQLELWAAQQRLLVQERLKQLQGGRQPTSSPVSPNADPSPIPPPPVNRVQTTPFSKQPAAPQTAQNTEGSAPTAQVQGQGQGQDDQQKDSGMWTDSEGILDKMPHLGQPAPTGRPKMVGNGPINMPPASLQSAMLEMREKVKKIVDDCMAKSGITNPMEQVVQTGDLTKLAPVCRASDSVGPCVMEESSKAFGRDQMGMLGRRMMQSILMSLGQMCMKLTKTDQMPAGPKMTSPPVFPNPAPSMTKAAVTQGTVEKSDADSPTGPQKTDQVDDEPVKQFAKPIEDQPTQTASPHVQEDHVEVAEASFPMWMILTMVGACAALLFFCCLTVCLVLRCRRKKKSVELDREPEKLPVPAQPNIYAASPCVPPPAYATTAVRQTLGGEEEEEMDDKNFKIPEDGVKMADEKKVAEEKGEEGEK